VCVIIIIIITEYTIRRMCHDWCSCDALSLTKRRELLLCSASDIDTITTALCEVMIHRVWSRCLTGGRGAPCQHEDGSCIRPGTQRRPRV